SRCGTCFWSTSYSLADGKRGMGKGGRESGLGKAVGSRLTGWCQLAAASSSPHGLGSHGSLREQSQPSPPTPLPRRGEGRKNPLTPSPSPRRERGARQIG